MILRTHLILLLKLSALIPLLLICLSLQAQKEKELRKLIKYTYTITCGDLGYTTHALDYCEKMIEKYPDWYVPRLIFPIAVSTKHYVESRALMGYIKVHDPYSLRREAAKFIMRQRLYSKPLKVDFSKTVDQKSFAEELFKFEVNSQILSNLDDVIKQYKRMAKDPVFLHKVNVFATYHSQKTNELVDFLAKRPDIEECRKDYMTLRKRLPANAMREIQDVIRKQNLPRIYLSDEDFIVAGAILFGSMLAIANDSGASGSAGDNDPSPTFSYSGGASYSKIEDLYHSSFNVIKNRDIDRPYMEDIHIRYADLNESGNHLITIGDKYERHDYGRQDELVKYQYNPKNKQLLQVDTNHEEVESYEVVGDYTENLKLALDAAIKDYIDDNIANKTK